MLKKDDVLKERYTIIKLLGQGGTAKTYVAKDAATQKNVVLKVINLRDIDDWKIIDLFEREINVLKGLDHPFIPDYIDNFKVELKDRNLYVLVQEYVDGDNLESLVKKGRRFSPDEIKNIFKSLLKILIYIHNLHPPVIHRDINPKNLIINKVGNIYVVDFGAVGSIMKDTIVAARSDTFVGTVGYMAHEQFFGKALPASDLYALGMTIVYLFTGIEPFKMELDGMSINLDAYSNIPDKVKAVLRKMIEPDYKKRLQSAQQVLDLFESNVQLSASPHAESALDVLRDEMQLPDLLLSFLPENKIRLKKLNSKEKLIILPRVIDSSIIFLPLGIIFTPLSILLFLLFFFFPFIFKNVLSLPFTFGMIGIPFLCIGLMLLIKREIHLSEDKISVIQTRAGFIKTVEDLLLEEYKGVKIKENGSITSKKGEKVISSQQLYSVSIFSSNKSIDLGSKYTMEQIEFLKEAIENHYVK